MDSLTQIVLGAAVGEAALGKRVGNSAMIWGAIAGTIPDMDVLSNLFMSPIDALAFHRGISHSIAFNILLAFLMGWLVSELYKQSWHRYIGVVFWNVLGLCLAGFLIYTLGADFRPIFFAVLFMGLWSYLVYKRYFRDSYETPVAPLKGWIWLFVLALVTHPVLDCFTNYGTQIWLPFSDNRVAFNNISVVDPLYTIPFIICLLMAASLNRTHDSRRFWNFAGISISSFYMIFTIVNKVRVNTIFENSLAIENIQYERFMTTPTLLNNVLWYGIAETRDGYVYGTYSFLDKDKVFKLQKRPKDFLSLGDTLQNDNTLKTLQWFSNGYFNLKPVNDTLYEYTDLRFGSMTFDDTKERDIFRFSLRRNNYGTFELLKDRQRPEMNPGKAFSALWSRILGRSNQKPL